MSKATCIMVQGTMSGAGKSLLCAALCRIFAQDGWRVAPFKSQNMALNSFVTRDGLEMGRAQVVQAQAAGVEPDVRMNPILLKPSSDVGSQVIVNGKARGQMSAADYFRMKRSLIPDILEAYNSLAAENDIIVIVSGCSAQAAAKAGLMDPVHAKELCGAGLKRVCELANIPPVLHMGSCVDISRMMILASELSKDSGLNISQLPVVGCAPEWMSEKAVSIGNYVVATGIETYLGVDPYSKGSSEITALLQGTEGGCQEWVEAHFVVEKDIDKLGDRMIESIEAKRAALGI